jgi:hypothetical protein
MYYKLKTDTYPVSRPYRLRLTDGLTITDPTEEQLTAAGWIKAPEQPVLVYPQRLDWVNNAWVVREPNSVETEQQWEQVRSRCQELLAASDYRVIKATELAAVNGTSLAVELSPLVISYRQALRDIYNNVNNLDPFFVVWPTLEEPLNGN